MVPCPDHVVVNRAEGEAHPFRDLGIGQAIDAKGGLKPPQLDRAFASRLRTCSILGEVVDVDIFTSVAGSDFGLSREIHCQIGGNAKQMTRQPAS